MNENRIRENRIGSKLTEVSTKKGWTFYMLSRSSGVPLTTLLHIVDGSTKNPGIYTVMRLCDALELPLEELIGEIK
ncbi:MAG: helix-turn-helix transcriptional regulator [Eubacteriales bacterium]|nr:helix-turn-helix transcriptional regulator [Eubacteriales bacterium]